MRAFLRAAVTGLSVLLVLTLLESPVLAFGPVPIQGPVAVKASKACPESRDDKVSAAAAARLCGGSVEVLGLRSETMQVWSEKDGSFHARASMGPERFKDGDKWYNVDLTMQANPDGSVGPKAHPRGLRLSGASTASEVDLLSVRMGADAAADKMTLKWLGGLPEPTLAGEKATYPDVMPGLDFVVVATPSGFEQFVVVKTRSAVTLLRDLKLALRPGELTLADDGSGGMSFKDKGGNVVASTPAPLMWDAAIEPRSGDPVNVRKGTLKVRQGKGLGAAKELVLGADEGWMLDPKRQFPLTIDPGLTSDNDTWVSTAYTSSQFGSVDLKLGTWNGGEEKARTYLRWFYDPIYGRQITSATLYLWEWHAFSCRSAEWQLWSAGYIDPNTTWANKPAPITYYSSSWQTRGHPDCGSDGWVSIDARGFLQDVANSAYPYITMNLLAPDETNSDSWKKFNSANASGNRPYLDITFNEPPTISAMSTSPGTSCATGAGRPYMTNLTPTLGATANDTEGSPSNLQFEWWVAGGSQPIRSQTVSNVPNGSGANVSVPAGDFAENGTYSWRVRADGGPGVQGAWSQSCEFTIDTIKPGVPFVSSKDGKYPSTSVDNTWGHGGYGQAGTFTLTPASPSSDLGSFVYRLDNQTDPTTVSATAAVDVAITPSEDGVRTLTVWAKDKAGNQSDSATYVFNVGRAGLSLPRPGANVVKRTPLSIDGDAAYTRTRFQYRRGPGGAERDIPWSNLTTSGNQPVSAANGNPVALTDLGGRGVWNTLDTLGDVGGVVQVRARLYGNSGYVPSLAIRNPAAARCIDVANYGTGNGSRVHSWDCHGMGNQQFELGPDGMIHNPISGRCLDATAYGTTNGTKIQLWDCLGGANQKFERLGDGQIRNPVSGRCLNIMGGAPFSNGQDIILWDCNGTNNMVFEDIETAYSTQWITINADPDADGAATTEAGPGTVNLLTGDNTLSATDVDEFGMTVRRTASSRDPNQGWTPQGERLSDNQQRVNTDLTGFGAYEATLARVTTLGHGSNDSLEIRPLESGTTTWGPQGDTFASVGGDGGGGLRLDMRQGKRYRATGWIYVPASTGLALSGSLGTTRGQRIVFLYKTPAGYVEVPSSQASFVDGWQQLTVDVTLPADATEAFVRLYNGQPTGTGQSAKAVWWDDISVRELIAPFGPQWKGGATDEAAGNDYATLDIPSADLVRINMVGGGAITFGLGVGNTYFPEPGAELLTLIKDTPTSYLLSEPDGTNVQFTKQAGSGTFVATSTWVGEGDAKRSTTTTYVWDITDNRTLIKRVISPTELGVGDCGAAVPAKGCQVIQYDYATATTATATQFGDFVDQVQAIKLWSWNPATNAVDSIDVAKYLYDNNGRLRQVYDPRPPGGNLTTAYDYDSEGRVIKSTPPGVLPWMFDYGPMTPAAVPTVGNPLLDWRMDAGTGTMVADSSGNNRNGTAANTAWGAGGGSNDISDKGLSFNGSGSTVTGPSGVINTAQSFTVSAWARLDSAANWAAVVSQDGNRVSDFTLQFDPVAKKWAFSGNLSDSDNPDTVRAYSAAAPVLGQWTHLTGVYDNAAGQLRLYVNGKLEGSTAYTAWVSAGAFVSGRDKWNGFPVSFFPGGIDDVHAYSSALTAAQVGQLAAMRFVDNSSGWLYRVRRASLLQGSGTQLGPESATRVVYGVPLTKTAGGPYDMDQASAATWGQTEMPLDATAVFGPQDDPQVVSATPTTPGINGYKYASVYYMNASGQQVNLAVPSAAGVAAGYVSTTQFDRYGNAVWSLDAMNRLLALNQLPDSQAQLGELGLAGASTAERANELATISRYSPDGSELAEKIGPRMIGVLEAAFNGQPAGSSIAGRYHTLLRYDEGKPDGKVYHLATTETSAFATSGGDTSIRVRKNGYDAINGSASGWALGKTTKVTSDAGTGGINVDSYMVYDTSGRMIKAWGVGSTGTDAQAKQTIHYTADANTDDAACGNHPEWAGKPCVSKSIGGVTGHDPANMPGTLPVTRITAYNRYGDVAIAIETNAGKTRTTTMSYDNAGRISQAARTSDDGSVALPAMNMTYDSLTGLAVSTSAGGATVSQQFDVLGRPIRYTDADGANTTSEYDQFGRPARTVDPTGTVTYSYDRVAEPRGLLTSLSDSTAGTFTVQYNAAGQIDRMAYPGGVTRVDTFDTNHQPTQRSYRRDSDGMVIYTESVTRNVYGQVVSDSYTGSRSKQYAYDRMGRLTKATQIGSGGYCTIRAYQYDTRSNRKKLETWLPGATGACDETGVADTTVSSTLDSADRLVSDTAGQYAYDAFGRTTAMPGGLVNTFYTDDMVASQQQGNSRQSWSLDPTERLRTSTTDTFSGGVWGNTLTKVNHYGDSGDSPRWITENTATGLWTRNVVGPDGGLALTVTQAGLNLLNGANLHGDTAFNYDINTTAGISYVDFDEFGNKIEGDAGRYGWLGTYQRSSEAFGGVILMGTRLYAPSLGRFLSVDRVPGGSLTAYDYCNADPVNCFDLDGTCPPCAVAAGAVALLEMILIAILAAIVIILVIAAIIEYLPKIVEALAKLVTIILTVVVIAFARFMNWLNNQWNKFKEWAKRLIRRVINRVKRAIRQIRQALSRIWNWLKGRLRDGIAGAIAGGGAGEFLGKRAGCQIGKALGAGCEAGSKVGEDVGGWGGAAGGFLCGILTRSWSCGLLK